MKKILSLCMLAFVMTMVAAGSSQGFISPDRMVNWSNPGPGVTGGIPSRTTIFANVKNSPYGAVGNGVADDTSAIQRAINACPQDQVVYIPAGTYRITQSLRLDRRIVVRGDGPANTKIKLDSSTSQSVFAVGTYSENNRIDDLTGGYTKGSTSIIASDPFWFQAGDYIIISQLDTGNPLIGSTGCGWFKRSQRSIGQTLKITGKSGNTLTVDPPLHWTYEAKYSPQIERVAVNLTNSLEYAGIEDLYMERSQNSGQQHYMIQVWNAANCWFKNIESYRVSGRHIALFRSFRCTIRDSYFHHAWAYTSGGLAYGISIANYSSDNLIENNIVYYLNFPIALENSGGGNVIAYNYTEGAWLNEGDKMYQMADIGTHCDYPHMELFEGNWSTHICPDYEHGGSGYLTFFRNHLDGETTFPKDSPPIPSTNNNNGAFDIRQMNTNMNIVGNVLLKPGDTGQYECFLTGSPQCNSGVTTRYVYKFQNTGDIYTTAYRQGNYNYITNSAIWVNSTVETLPNSLYLTSKPAFFGSLLWPPFGPDVNPKIGTIPAKQRFDGGSSPAFVPRPPGNLRPES